jgi:folylpolyglutamate synthase/dihydropteroate synthase
LCDLLLEKGGNAESADSPAGALQLAKDAAGPRGLVLAAGSLFLAAEVREAALGIEPEVYPSLARKGG